MIHAAAKTPRERRHEENLRRILETAMGMVEEGGFDALSINKLAEAVDYTPGALYRYFGSKDALLSQLIEQILGEVHQHLLAAQAQLRPGASPLAHIFVLADGYREFAKREPHRFGLLAMSLAQPRILLRDDADARPVMKRMWAAMRPLADAYAAAAGDGLLAPGDPAERTLCVFAFLQGLLPLRKRARSAPGVAIDVDRLAVEGLSALLRGWGGGPRTVEAARQVTRRTNRAGDKR